jgi:hypothetical protein
MKNSNFPLWITVVLIILLIWNIIGVLNFYNQVTISEQDLMNLPIEQQNFIANIPFWTIIAFGIAVVGGSLGCMALLLKKKVANIFLQLSLAGVIAQMYHNLVIAKALDIYGPGQITMPIMIISFSILLVWLSKYATKKEWIS